MTPLPFAWPYALVFWPVFAWAFAPEFSIVRRARREQKSSDRKSLQVIFIGQSLSSLLAFGLSGVARWRILPTHAVAVFLAGVAVLVAGSLLRRHCFRMLGSSFTGDVRASSDQRVIESGAYRYLRHPSYTAGTLMNMGIGIALGSWMSMGLYALGSIGSYAYRISVEEKALLDSIGEPYRAFMQTRKRMIPFVY